jgi:hypothetical protein
MVGPLARRLTDEAKREWDVRMKYVSPAGELGLTKRLDARRLEYAVPDQVFRIAGLFDRILLWPMPDADMGEGMASEHIYFAETKRKDEEYRRSRCLLVGAGIQALNELRSNGTDLGDIVYILHLNPWWIPVGKSREGVEWHVRACSVGDLCGNEDLAQELRAGTIRYEEDKDDGLIRVLRDGKRLEPIRPSMREDY